MTWTEEITETLRRSGFIAPRFMRTASISGEHLEEWAASGMDTAPFDQWPSILVTGVPYRVSGPEDLSTPDSPHGLFAPFARRNYYRGSVSFLKNALAPIRSRHGYEEKKIRLFSNSRIPEKPLAVLAGLGSYGKNSLVISEEHGSAFIIAGAFLPLDMPDPGNAPNRRYGPVDISRGAYCGSCARCIETCPVGAIIAPGVVDRSRCLQSLSAIHVPLTDAQMTAWGKRIYGCNTCQDVCPYNQELYEATTNEAAPNEAAPAAGIDIGEGRPGPSVPLLALLERDTPERMREFFRGTVLDMGWIDQRAILRNAIIAAGNALSEAGDAGSISAAGREDLRQAVSRYADSPDPVLRHTARWSLERAGK